MSTTKNKILNLANSYVGTKEGSSKHHKIIDTYNAHKPLARSYKVKYTDNWCATFISFLAIKCGATDIIPTECSCGRMIELMKKKGIWIENDNIAPKAGDIIMYDWDKKDGWPEHVGIVEKVSSSIITVIEGNKNNAVSKRTITVGNSSIRGYGRPKYDTVKDETPVKPQKPNKPSTPTKNDKYDSWVADLQKELNKQYKAGLKVDGLEGPKTLAACPTVKKGAKGNITKLIQKRLNSVGFSISVDGVFGNDTYNAIKVFQKNRKLSSDGIVGKNTWKFLLNGKIY